MKNRRLKHAIEYFLLRVLSAWMRSLPLSQGLATHKHLAKFWYERVRIRRHQTLKNLHFAFPEVQERAIKDLARAAYCHVSRVAVEHLLLPKMLRLGIEPYVGDGNWEVLDQALGEGCGVILLTAHQGNWEMAGAVITARGYPYWAIAGNMKNKKVDRFINGHRESAGVTIVRPKESGQRIPVALKAGAIVNLLADQDAGNKGMFVPFFGRPASTHSGWAILAARYRAPLVYLMTYYQDAKHHFHFERYEGDGEVGYSRETIFKMVSWYNASLERDIRRFPEQYFWMHRRWKTVPAAASSS